MKKKKAYRNPKRNRMTYRQRCLKKLESFLQFMMIWTLIRKPITTKWRLAIVAAIDTYDYYCSSRYLVPLKRTRIRSIHYREYVLSGKDKRHFYDAFRMTKPQFDFIVNLIKKHSVFQRTWRKPQAPVEVQLKVALHRFTHDGSLSSFAAVGRQLGVSVGSVVHYTRRVASALCAHITTYIKWPTSKEKEDIKKYLGKGNFKDVIGAVDGTMIPVHRAPSFGRDSFATRKSNFAVGATGICDHRGVFTFFSTGYTGTRHDSAAYKDTPLYQRKEEFFLGDEHLIGDAAYALTPTVITAYKGKNQPPEKDDFNKKLRSSRVKIEHAFGWLKAFCRCLNSLRLDYCSENDMRRLNQQIMACVVLYNILETVEFKNNEAESDEMDGFMDWDEQSDDEPEDEPEDDLDTDDQSDEAEDYDDDEGSGASSEDEMAEGPLYVDTPWRLFATAAEERRYEKVQRALGVRKRERIRIAMQQ